MVHLFFLLWIILIKMGLPAWAGHSIQLFPWTHAMAEKRRLARTQGGGCSHLAHPWASQVPCPLLGFMGKG